MVTEYLDPPFDEGIKKTAYQLYTNLTKRYDVRVLCHKGIKNDKNVIAENTDKLFLGKTISRQANWAYPNIFAS